MRHRLAAADPAYGGETLWYEYQDDDPSCRPMHGDGSWESLVVRTGYYDTFDFMRVEPSGGFYQRRLHFTDATAGGREDKPGTGLDPIWVAQEIGETIATGLIYAAALGYDKESTTLGFGFWWSGLKGRSLISAGSYLRMLPYQYKSMTSDVKTSIEVPLTTAPISVAPFAIKAMRPLFAIFDGFSLDSVLAERQIKQRLERHP